MLKAILLKKSSDFIKDGDGNQVEINSAGRTMVRKFIAKSGGGKKVAELTGLHENTIYKLNNTGTCAPDTWETMFTAIQSHS